MSILGLIGKIPGIPALGWKIATIGSGIAMLGLLTFTGAQMMENRHLTKLNVQLDQSINDPRTGYVRQVVQATTNVEQLKAGIASQRQKFEAKAAEDAANLAAVTAELAAVQRANVGLRAQSARISAKPPQGATLEARVLDVDAKLLETLK